MIRPAYNDCHVCCEPTINTEDDYGEFTCDNCAQNAAEIAWERHCEAFHDGGSTQFVSLAEQQAAARKLK